MYAAGESARNEKSLPSCTWVDGPSGMWNFEKVFVLMEMLQRSMSSDGSLHETPKPIGTTTIEIGVATGKKHALRWIKVSKWVWFCWCWGVPHKSSSIQTESQSFNVHVFHGGMRAQYTSNEVHSISKEATCRSPRSAADVWATCLPYMHLG